MNHSYCSTPYTDVRHRTRAADVFVLKIVSDNAANDAAYPQFTGTVLKPCGGGVHKFE